LLVFGRRTSSEQAADPAPGEAKTGGKGRPTPSRKDAEAARKKRMTPPRTRKEANALHRERMKAQRSKMRQAMETGDERYLPARDAGPVKKYVRDYVDSHRTIGQFLIPIFVAIFVLVYIRTPWAAALGSLAWMVVLAALVVDSVRIMWGVKKGVAARFGKAETKGITMYTLMRSWQMRRLRLPKPQVRPGDTI
jgi:hypothetical protein